MTSTTDPTTTKLLEYFSDLTAVAEETFEKNKVVIAKENRGAQGSKEYSRSYQLITDAMETKFGAAKHFIANSRDGESDSGNTKYKNIQEQFVGNYSKLAIAEGHCEKYDLMDILQIPDYRDITAAHPSHEWGLNKSNMFKHWTKLSQSTMLDWQQDSSRNTPDESVAVRLPLQFVHHRAPPMC